MGSIADHRGAADSLSEFGLMMREYQEFAVLGEFVDKVVAFSRHLQEIGSTLNRDMQSQLLTPLDNVIEGDLAEAEFSKKRFNKVLSDYDSINKRIQQMNAKGAVNPQKLQEAQKEQEQCQAKFDSVSVQTMQTLTDVNNRVEFQMFQTLMQYVETYSLFFQRGSVLMHEVMGDLQKYRVFAEKKREAQESGQAVEAVRLEDIAAGDLQNAPRDALERAVHEIIDKERSYVRKLEVVSKTYIQSIRVDDQLASKFTDEVQQTIFGNMQELLAMHKGFMLELEHEPPRYPHYRISSLFAPLIPRFKMYSIYIRRYSQAINALDQLEAKNQNVRKFMRVMDRKGGLRGLLGEPLGRVPGYVLSLQQLADATLEDDTERLALVDCIDQLRRLAEELQQAQKESSNISTMLGVFNELAAYTGGTLLEPSRVLRREASLTVHFVVDGQAKQELNKFYLCNDVLIQAKKKGLLHGNKKLAPADQDKKYIFLRQFVLDGASVDLLPDNEEASMENAFELKSDTGSVVLSCSGPTERTDWVNLLQSMIEGTVTNAVFEVPLQVVMSNQRDQSIDLPEVLVVCGDYLRERSLATEGIFRMSGSKREIATIIGKFNKGEMVNLDVETSDEHSVAGVLKHWVRMLPEPLLTYGLLDEFLAGGTDLERIRETMARLPNLYLRCASYLFFLLHSVNLNCEVNKMDAKNLAIVFAPGLLRREGASDFDTSHYEQAYAVVAFIVDHYVEVFDGFTVTDGNIVQRNPLEAAPSPHRAAMARTASATKFIVNPAPPNKARGGLGGSSENLPTVAAVGSGGGGGARAPAPQSGPAVKMSITPLRKTGSKVNSRSPSSASSPRSNRSPSTDVLPDPSAESDEAPPDTPAPVPTSQRGGATAATFTPPPAGSPRGETPPSQQAPAPPPSSGRPPCARCGEQIRGAGLKALGAAWHKDCFVCTHCGQPFTGKILQKDGNPYCENDFRTLFGGSQARNCRACGERITGPFMKALNGFWHADHFVCRECGGSVSEGYYEKDDWPHCKSCFGE